MSQLINVLDKPTIDSSIIKKDYHSYSPYLRSYEKNYKQQLLLENSGWSIDDADLKIEKGNFNFCVPLNLLLGFAEDYNKILLNGKHDLILLKGKYIDDVYKRTAATLTMAQLKMTTSDAYKLYKINVVSKQTAVLVPFRSWDFYYNQVVSQSTTFIWNVKLGVETESPRFIIIAFKRDKKHVHCDLTDVKVYLNSEAYPYDGLNKNFNLHRYTLL